MAAVVAKRSATQTQTWETSRRVPVTFTHQIAKKRPVWKDGELCVSGGVARLVNDAGRELECVTTTRALLEALDSGEVLDGFFDGHRVEPSGPVGSAACATVSATSAISANSARDSTILPQATEVAAPPAGGAPVSRPFRKPRRALLPKSPEAPPQPVLVAQATPPRMAHAASDVPMSCSRPAPAALLASEGASIDLWAECVNLEQEDQRRRRLKRGRSSDDLWDLCSMELFVPSNLEKQIGKMRQRWRTQEADVMK
eukprot:TRINITY_DN75838_c0_g1_i1.p1 TRINITY_DN75838_c0_g1~~TRINITY_DN75838_c0_g1_i1.p1  ORF type:complete len:257 (+),score=37.91 TRINITY_DN75838_c0_g1_i1:66-836(+)